MERSNKVSPQVQLRRRWRDWSECSEDCYKMRHRMNCEDLLAQNSLANKNLNSTNASDNRQPANQQAKRQSVDENDPFKLKKLKDEEEEEEERELLMKADQVEDDDYADEGDEEDQTDSCDNVDPNKTFETKPCTGGKCRPSSSATSTDQPSVGVTTILSRGYQARQRHRDQARDPQQRQHNQKALSPLLDSPLTTIGEEKGPGRASPFLAGPQASKAGRVVPSSSSRLDNSMLDKNFKNGYHHNDSSGQEASSGSLGLQPFKSQGNETAQGERSGPNVIGPFATGSMWPQQLWNSSDALGPQASLIHWTILIGALLTIILLIMLILRKLFATTFPSYHWMLAKQTLKSSSKQRLGAATVVAPDYCPTMQGPFGCSQASAHRQMHPANALVIENVDYHKSQATTRPPHHMCYAWRHQPPANLEPRAFSPCELEHASGAHRFVANIAGGSHLLANGEAKFNTDLQDIYMEPASRVSAGSSQRSRYQNRHMQNNSNYNTLSSCCHETTHHPEGADKGFVLTADFVSPSSATPGQCQENWINSYLYSTATNTRTRSQTKNRKSLSEASSHGNLAAANDDDDDEELIRRRRGHDKQARSQRHKSSNYLEMNDSRSASLSSTDESPSIQSTTAQMLSNAASSSFEQAPDFEPTSSACLNSNQIMCSEQQLLGSPASLGGKIRNNKLTCLVTAQSAALSQPNSPMFANKQQFNNKPFNHKPHHRPSLSGSSSRANRASTSRTTLGSASIEPPNQSDYALPETSHTSNEGFANAFVDLPPNRNPLEGSTATSDCDNNKHFYEEISQDRTGNR